MTAGANISDFVSELEGLGAGPGHIRRIFRAWMHMGPWTERANCRYPAAVAARLPDIRRRLESLSSQLPVVSRSSGSVKLIIGLADGEAVESVLLPRNALCLSSQVGCAVGCAFCMSGRGGLVRQLGSAEIVAQAAEARLIRPGIRKILFMGMGEPSHNMRAVGEAVEFLGTVLNLAHKDIVVSTVGDRRLFEFLPALKVRPALALSLHSTDDAVRRRLLGRAPAIPASELIDLALGYGRAVRYPVQFEWTLVKGVNDSPGEAARLAERLAGESAMVNYIEVNPVEGSGFESPEHSHIEDLITEFRKRGIVATLRESAARDINGGCGQLRARMLQREEGPCRAAARS